MKEAEKDRIIENMIHKLLGISCLIGLYEHCLLNDNIEHKWITFFITIFIPIFSIYLLCVFKKLCVFENIKNLNEYHETYCGLQNHYISLILYVIINPLQYDYNDIGITGAICKYVVTIIILCLAVGYFLKEIIETEEYRLSEEKYRLKEIENLRTINQLKILLNSYQNNCDKDCKDILERENTDKPKKSNKMKKTQ